MHICSILQTETHSHGILLWIQAISDQLVKEELRQSHTIHIAKIISTLFTICSGGHSATASWPENSSEV